MTVPNATASVETPRISSPVPGQDRVMMSFSRAAVVPAVNGCYRRCPIVASAGSSGPAPLSTITRSSGAALSNRTTTATPCEWRAPPPSCTVSGSYFGRAGKLGMVGSC